MSARIVTWNLERKRPDSPLGAKATEYLFSLSPDVMALTEARTGFPVETGHSLWCEPPRGTAFAKNERKVLLWSKEPWTAVDRVGHDGLDQTRFISATTQTSIGPIRVLGVCIPWNMAEVKYPIDKKRKPWELHIKFLETLSKLTGDLTTPTVIAGDFNQQVPYVGYGNRAAAQVLDTTFSPMTIATGGQVPGATRPGIDHIALSTHLQASKVWGWPSTLNGDRLSDHEGAGLDIGLSVSGQPSCLQ